MYIYMYIMIYNITYCLLAKAICVRILNLKCSQLWDGFHHHFT